MVGPQANCGYPRIRWKTDFQIAEQRTEGPRIPPETAVGHVRQRLDLEAMHHAGFAQQVDIAAALVPSPPRD